MTEQATNAAAAAPTIDDDGLEAELASIIGSPQGQAPAGEATPADPQAQPVDAQEIAPDLEQQLIESAKARQGERALREPLDLMRQELQALKSAVASSPSAALAKAVADKDPAAFAAACKSAGLDPDLVQQLATRAKLGPSPQDQIRAAAESAVAATLEQLGIKPQAQAQQAPPQGDPSETLGVYAAYVDGAAERFPLQAAMGEYLGPAVIHYIREHLIGKGVTTQAVDALQHEQVASMFEKHLASRSRGSKPSGATIASGDQAPPSSGTPTASGGPTPTGSSTPRSITNGHAADASRTRPRTKREIDEELERELNDMMRARA